MGNVPAGLFRIMERPFTEAHLNVSIFREMWGVTSDGFTIDTERP